MVKVLQKELFLQKRKLYLADFIFGEITDVCRHWNFNFDKKLFFSFLFFQDSFTWVAV